MAQIPGCLEIFQATVRVNIRANCFTTPKAFPTGGTIRASSLTVTSAPGNTATLYIATQNGANSAATYWRSPSSATTRERTMIKLAAGQSYTFTGIPMGSAAYREIVFGSLRSYLHASSTPCLGIISYYGQSR